MLAAGERKYRSIGSIGAKDGFIDVQEREVKEIDSLIESSSIAVAALMFSLQTEFICIIGKAVASYSQKQVGVAAWLESWLTHLGVVGSSPGRDNL